MLAGPLTHPPALRLCSGADVWLQHAGGRWDADEAYEGQIGFEVRC